MDVKSLKASFASFEQVESTANQLQIIGSKIKWSGLVGSSKSIVASVVANQSPGNHVFILEDKEQAAYFLNDLQGMYPKNGNILFYPASYRVPYEIEKTDNANVVARAEVLDKVAKSKNTWIVTYPKALIEKIPSKKLLSKSTFTLQ